VRVRDSVPANNRFSICIFNKTVLKPAFMKLSEFIVLTQEEKRFIVLHEGVPIAKRQVLNYMVFLFQLPEYYVETYCCRESKEVHEYLVFQNTACLTPYLNGIPIDNLLN